MGKRGYAPGDIPNDVLDGYPFPTEEMRQLVGKPRLWPSTGDNLGRALFMSFFPDPPWHCEKCGQQIWDTGVGRNSLHIHHVNEDREDNRLINLCPMHGSCHRKEHNQRRIRSQRSKTLERKSSVQS